MKIVLKYRLFLILLICSSYNIYADESTLSNSENANFKEIDSLVTLRDINRIASKTINHIINQYSLPLYNSYFDIVSQDVEVYPLHENYRRIFKRLGLLVEDVRIGYSAYLGNAFNKVAMTDCNTVYFPHPSFVKKLKDGKKITKKQMHLLLHELGHSLQCRKATKKMYAQRWFSELSPATIKALKSGRVETKNIHDAMPLEKEADEFSKKMYLEVIKY
ncbi:MAG: hypothetical protein K6L75_12415 [Cellvibrionaceae bacterium]